MDNMSIYNAVRTVPDTAQKKITGGRLNGKTDINPMWRIKTLTEQFGACGVGWKYTIDRQWLEPGANGEIAAFCNISLYIKSGDIWSEAIPGTGGSAFITNEKSGAYTSDECYKMAFTDALSVTCKALGFGADIYWSADKTKYDKPQDKPQTDDAQTPDDLKALLAATTTPERKALASAIGKEWGCKSLKAIPHSRVEEFIKSLEST